MLSASFREYMAIMIPSSRLGSQDGGLGALASQLVGKGLVSSPVPLDAISLFCPL